MNNTSTIQKMLATTAQEKTVAFCKKENIDAVAIKKMFGEKSVSSWGK